MAQKSGEELRPPVVVKTPQILVVFPLPWGMVGFILQPFEIIHKILRPIKLFSFGWNEICFKIG